MTWAISRRATARPPEGGHHVCHVRL